MTTGGWVFLVVCWGAILGTLGFGLSRVLGARDEADE